MTRFAPILTLLAVAAVGGALFVTTTTMDAGRPAAANPAAASSAASPDAPPEGTPGEIELADLPIVGAEEQAGGEPAAPSREIELGDLPIVGAEEDAGDAPAGERKEISLADLEIVGAAAPEEGTGPQQGAEPEPTEGEGAAPGRTEISLGDIEVVRRATPGAAGAAEEQPAAPTGDVLYAGRTADREMTVAVAISQGQATAYVCDGDTVEVWFTGPVEPGTFSLKPARGLARMTVSISAAGIEGTVDVTGQRREYAAKSTNLVAALTAGRDDVGDVAERAGAPS